jgi:predicted RNase H-like nuclease
MYYIGIDPSWSGKNNTAVVVCDNTLQVIESCYTNDIKKIILAIVPFKDAIIGIDAPLIIKNETGHRRHETEFLRVFSRFGLGLHAVNKKRYPYFFPEVLYKELSALGYSFNKNNIYEVYPHATIMTCFTHMQLLQYKSKYGVTVRRKNMEKLYNYLAGVVTCGYLFTGTIAQAKGKQLKKYEDYLDALVCAYTIYYCMHKKCYRFGDPENGILLVPAIEGPI